MSKETKEIANEIARQLGGFGKLKAMVNARDFGCGESNGNPYLSFKFSMYPRANTCQIVLTVSDTYTVRFWKVTTKKRELVSEHEQIYADMLIELFESETGLDLSL